MIKRIPYGLWLDMVNMGDPIIIPHVFLLKKGKVSDILVGSVFFRSNCEHPFAK